MSSLREHELYNLYNRSNVGPIAGFKSLDDLAQCVSVLTRLQIKLEKKILRMEDKVNRLQRKLKREKK